MGEPNLNDIDDYRNKESSTKRKTVWIVVGLCLLIGAIIAISRGYFTEVSDEIHVQDQSVLPNKY